MKIATALRWTLVGLYCSFIFFLSHQPTLPVPQTIEHQDKVFHFLAYFILGVLAAFSLPSTLRFRWLWAALIASVYGISDEFHQSFVPGRETEFLDWLADTLGGMAGAWAYLELRKKSKKLPFSVHR
jgi:VanZ family protein